MSLLGRMLAGALVPKNANGISYSDKPAGWFVDWLGGGGKTAAGVRVSPTSALQQSSAVFACCNVRSQDVGKCQTFLWRLDPKTGKKVKAVDHWAYDLILNKPNPRNTAMEFKQVLQLQLDLRGNAYAFKQRNGTGKVIALWPIPSNWVQVLETFDGELFYRVTPPHAEEMVISADDMVHRRGMSLDGKVGISPIAYHRETIGMAIAAQTYGAAFFGNSAQPSGVLTVPTVLSQPASDKLRADWERKFKGAGNSHRFAIFDGGMTWNQTSMDNTDAQWLETRRFQNTEIYRLYRMPPHKVQDLDRATFTNIEQQNIEYVTDGLSTELIGWDLTWAKDLLTDAERKTLFFKTDSEVLMRGSFLERMQGFAIGRSWSLFNSDECRDKMDMNPCTDGKGDTYLQPLNMVPQGTPVGATKDSSNAADPALDGGKNPTGSDTSPAEPSNGGNDPAKNLEVANTIFNVAKRILAEATAAAAVHPNVET